MSDDYNNSLMPGDEALNFEDEVEIPPLEPELKPKLEPEPEPESVVRDEKGSKKKTKKALKKVMTKVRRISTIAGEELVVVVDEKTGIGYLAPLDTQFVRGETSLDLSELEQAYSWDQEIEAMLPDREIMIRNIRHSIWQSGGYKPGRGSVGRRMNQAWPYRLDEK